MTDRTREMHRPYAAALYRALALGRLAPETAARLWGVSERAVYRRSENDVPMRVYEPALLIGQPGGVELFAELTGATAAGLIVTAPPTTPPGPADLVHEALVLGGHAGRVMAAVDAVTGPTSPGGRRIVGEERAAVRDAIVNLKRAAQVLEDHLGAAGDAA